MESGPLSVFRSEERVLSTERLEGVVNLCCCSAVERDQKVRKVQHVDGDTVTPIPGEPGCWVVVREEHKLFLLGERDDAQIVPLRSPEPPRV